MFKKKTRVEHVRSVCEIDFKDLQNMGINTVLFDIEGTIAPWGAHEVNSEVLKCIERSEISKIGIVTNMSQKHSDRAKKIADQIGARSYQYPKTRKHRKPRAYMILACIKELKTSPEKTVMIGDKLLDVLAAKNADLPKVLWVDMLHGPDHWFDRWIYRKVEPLLKRVIS